MKLTQRMRRKMRLLDLKHEAEIARINRPHKRFHYDVLAARAVRKVERAKHRLDAYEQSKRGGATLGRYTSGLHQKCRRKDLRLVGRWLGVRA